MKDQFNLDRFVVAQQGVIDRVLEELRQGRKSTHWMWFVFPQLRGLGRSSTAEYYGISSEAEAKSYLQHSILGPRLLQCTHILNGIEDRSVQQIFGEIDSIKFRSCMTLFLEMDRSQHEFAQALEKYFEAKPDKLTLELLRKLN